MFTHKRNHLVSSGRKPTPFILGLVLVVVISLVGCGVLPPASLPVTASTEGQIEPQAGTWKTWVLESGSQMRLPVPPDEQESEAEVQQLIDLVDQRDEAALAQIAYWNTGAPVYRWNRIAVSETLISNMGAPVAYRALALLNAGMYDATIAAWDSKYTYNRARPSDLDPSLTTVIPNMDSPSYPSEHAVVAGAASEILAYIFPDKAEEFRAQAEEAGQAFLLAGVQYPSDIEAGLDLGRQVAAMVIERGKADGSDAQFDGTMPTEPGYWTGEKPALPMFGTLKTFVLSSGSEFRPEPPLAYDSPEKAAEMDLLRSYERTPKSNAHAAFWEYGAGGNRHHAFWMDQISRLSLENDLSNNPPRAARVFALTSIALFDSSVATWDAKYAYWAIRPFQLDPEFKPQFTSPNHPSYPAAHATLSTTMAEVLGYLFPSDVEEFNALASDAAESRIWAGIHFPSDIEAGQTLGKNVADKVIDYARSDGAE